MVEHYVLVDCDRVQEYVFASPRLREICNASHLLDWIETQLLPTIATSLGGETIRSGGGVVLAKFEDQQKAWQFRREAPNIYRTYGCSAVAVDHPSRGPINDFYQDILCPIQRKLRSNKDSPRGWGFHISTLLAVPCESSGIGPAERPVDLPDQNVRRMKHAEMEKRLFEQPTHVSDSIEERLQRQFTLKVPHDFGGVVDWTQREDTRERDVPGTSEERVLGIIYADVNNLGGLLRTIAYQADLYSRFARRLRQAIEASLYEALLGVLSTAIDKRRRSRSTSLGPDAALPVRILYIGGDDLAVAIQGCYALDVVRSLLDRFEEKSKALLLELFKEPPGGLTHLTMSAGVVLAPYHYPIQNFNRLGRELEARAKRFGRRFQQTPPPAQVDFCLVKNNAVGNLAQLRRLQQLQNQQQGEIELHLFGGPYTTQELGLLTQGISALRQSSFPQNQWKALREVFSINKVHAQFRYAEWWISLRKDERELYIQHVCRALGLELPPHLPTWTRGYPATPVIDIIELSDLIWRLA